MGRAPARSAVARPMKTEMVLSDCFRRHAVIGHSTSDREERVPRYAAQLRIARERSLPSPLSQNAKSS